jgi:ribose/xylose/arabinose/galactoside ABC-type transport system permease subunit
VLVLEAAVALAVAVAKVEVLLKVAVAAEVLAPPAVVALAVAVAAVAVAAAVVAALALVRGAPHVVVSLADLANCRGNPLLLWVAFQALKRRVLFRCHRWDSINKVSLAIITMVNLQLFPQVSDRGSQKGQHLQPHR